MLALTSIQCSNAAQLATILASGIAVSAAAHEKVQLWSEDRLDGCPTPHFVLNYRWSRMEKACQPRMAAVMEASEAAAAAAQHITS